MLAGPIPVRILRAAPFHEFVAQLLAWGTRGDVSYVQRMRTQLVAARAVAQRLVELASEPHPVSGTGPSGPAILEIAGPREESLVEAARQLVARRGDALRVEAWSDPEDPDRELLENGALLPGADAILAGPTFEQWLDGAGEPMSAGRAGGAGDS